MNGWVVMVPLLRYVGTTYDLVGQRSPGVEVDTGTVNAFGVGLCTEWLKDTASYTGPATRTRLLNGWSISISA